MIRRFFSFLILCLFSVTSSALAQTHPPLIKPFYDLVDREFSGEKALETVAYIEQYFRVVGNKGFNNSIYYVEEILKREGFKEESIATSDDRLTYRIEKRPLEKPTWEPIGGSLKLSSSNTTILEFENNRNMIPINSFSTNGEQEYEVIYVGSGRNLDFEEDVKGKVVFAETSVGYLFNEAVVKRGAAGVLAYRLPSYTKPEVNQTSIQFSGIPYNDEKKAWGMLLSYAAKEALKKDLNEGNNQIKVHLETSFYESEELTIVAELKGSKYPEERFVFSAHVQEPGANDNASGVAALAEVASVSARLLRSEQINPERTITYLFGDEIVSTRRYIQEDEKRASSIKWGMSLDMVGQNTEITGGTFLIEKMPDPGAIWVRGNEKHSEWGGEILSKEDMMPHYFNDYVINRFEEQGKAKNWVVNVNPFEGGSDHVPFLRANIPGLLLWHFTDQFYHTDNDRIDKVSPTTLKNVGTGALISALVLTEDQEKIAGFMLDEIEEAALERLEVEFELSKSEIENGGNLADETDILETWADWYVKAIESTSDILTQPINSNRQAISEAVSKVLKKKEVLISQLN